MGEHVLQKGEGKKGEPYMERKFSEINSHKEQVRLRNVISPTCQLEVYDCGPNRSTHPSWFK